MEDNKRETRAPIQSAAAELAGAAVSKLDTGRAADSLPLRPLVETVGILEDDDIRLLSDGLPLGESGGLHDLMDEAEVIARAMAGRSWLPKMIPSRWLPQCRKCRLN